MILVFAKPAPDPSSVPVDPLTGKVLRGEADLIVPDQEIEALEFALRLGEATGQEVAVASMSPPHSAEELKSLFAYGVSDLFHLSDSKFAGADTIATSRALAALVKKLKPPFIVFGEASADSETGLVGPQVSAITGYRLAYKVRSLKTDGKKLVVEALAPWGRCEMEVHPPMCFVVGKGYFRPRRPSIRDIISRRGNYIVVKAGDLGEKLVGFRGSETDVAQVRRWELKERKPKKIPFDEGVKIARGWIGGETP